MNEILNNLDSIISSFLTGLGLYGPILGCILILIESMIPVLPLSVFITLNFYAFGNIYGFFLSYILTVIGCNLAFYLSRRVLKGRTSYLIKKYDNNKILKLIDNFSTIKFKNLVLLMAFPFTPAFLINILSGSSKMEHNKFLYASIVGKPFMVYFWGYIGVTLIQSLTHPKYLIEIVIIMAAAYVVSIILNKKFDLD